MGYFKDWVYLAETKEDYLKLIEKLLQKILTDSRREYALTHSWENNLKNISSAWLQQNLIKKC
jgi:hypothetical protein